MKKKYQIIIVLSLLFSAGKLSAQSYILQAATNGQTNNTCQGFISNTFCSYGFFPFNFQAYCEGQDRWQAFSNGGIGPIRINLTS